VAAPHPHPRFDPGQVLIEFRKDKQDNAFQWYFVRGNARDLLGGGPASFSQISGYMRQPNDGSIIALAEVPIKTQDGVPSLLAVGDIIALAGSQPMDSESVYGAHPAAENQPPTAGRFGPNDLAQIVEGPWRAPWGVLYWRIQEYTAAGLGSHGGWVREAARAGDRFRAKIRPDRLASNR
jgi:hypothetical protein